MLVDLGRNDLGRFWVRNGRSGKIFRSKNFPTHDLGSTVGASAEIKRRWTPAVSVRREPRVTKAAPVRSSTTWKTTRRHYGGAIGIWILREIWICVSRSGWHFENGKVSSGREPELWRTVYTEGISGMHQ